MDCSLAGSSVYRILQQEYWSGLPRSPPGDLPDPGIEPVSLMSLGLAGRFFTTWATWEAQFLSYPGSTWNFTFSNSIIEVIWELKFPWEDRMSIKHWVGKICGCHRNVYSWALSLGVESYSWMEWRFWDSLLNGFPRWFSDKEHAHQLRSVPSRSVMSDSVRPHGL